MTQRIREKLGHLSMQGKRILLAINGGPLSGKTTLGRDLKDLLGAEHHTTSSALRALGNSEIQKLMDEGRLVDNHTVIKAVNSIIEKSGAQFLIIDGCFRREEQTTEIIGHARDLGFVVIALRIDITRGMMTDRLPNRKEEGRPDDSGLESIGIRRSLYDANEYRVTRSTISLANFFRIIEVTSGMGKDVVTQEAMFHLANCLSMVSGKHNDFRSEPSEEGYPDLAGLQTVNT